MRSLAAVKSLLALIGLDYHNAARQHSKLYALHRSACIAIFALMIQPFLAFAVRNRHDLVNFTLTCAWLSSTFSCLTRFAFLHRHGASTMAGLFRTIETDVLQTTTAQCSVDVGGGTSAERFARAERRTRVFCYVYGALLSACGVVFSLISVLRVALADDDDESAAGPVRAMPLKCAYLFDTTPLSGYAVGFALQVVFIALGTVVYVATAGLFMGGCEYLMAYQRNLVQSIGAADATFRRTANRRRLHADVRAVVHQHWHIDALALGFGRLQSGVIFQEFVNSTLLITMFVFQLKAASHGSEYILCAVLAFGLTVELFVYAYYSTSLTHEVIDTGRTLYGCSWYAYPVHTRHAFGMLLMRMQRQRHMRGLSMIECSLETFQAVLNMVGSLIAVLGSME